MKRLLKTASALICSVMLIASCPGVAVLADSSYYEPFYSDADAIQEYTDGTQLEDFSTSGPLSLNGTNWMSGIPDDRYIYEINIPGAHDAATARVWNPCLSLPIGDVGVLLAPFARCQDKSITELLNLGVRFFDLRLTNDVDSSGMPNGTLILAHGEGILCYRCLNGDKVLTLKQTLNDIYEFLRDHPTETAIIKVKAEYTDTDYKDTWASIKETLEQYNVLYMEDRWPTLGEVRRKIVVMTTSSDDLGIKVMSFGDFNEQKTLDISSAYGIDHVSFLYENQYGETKAAKKIFVTKFLNQLNSKLGRAGTEHLKSGAILFSNSNFITKDPKTIIYDLIAKGPFIIADWESPREIAEVINPVINDYIRNAEEGTLFGWVVTDFSHETSETIWKSNYPDNNWDYYTGYQIKYVSTDGTTLHTDRVFPDETTKTFGNVVWEDKDNPGTFYEGEFTPKGYMTLVADGYLINYKKVSGGTLHQDYIVKGSETTTFNGEVWEDKDNPGTFYEGKFTPTANMTLIRKNVTIEYYDERHNFLGSQEAGKGETVKLKEFDMVEAYLYQWFTDRDGTQRYNGGEEITVTKDMTLIKMPNWLLNRNSEGSIEISPTAFLALVILLGLIVAITIVQLIVTAKKKE